MPTRLWHQGILRVLLMLMILTARSERLVAEESDFAGDDSVQREYLPVKSKVKNRRLVASARRSNALSDVTTLEDREESDEKSSRFSFGFFVSQNVFLQSNDMGSMGGMHSGSMGGMGSSMPGSSSGMGNMAGMSGMSGMGMMGSSNQMSLTQAMNTMMSNAFTMNAKAGYALSPSTSLTLSVLGDFQDGVGDPTAGVSFHVFLVPDLIGQLNLEIAAPLSKTSQDQGRITTLIWSTGPTYMKNGFLVGLVAYGAYAFYRPSPMGMNGMSGMGMNGGQGNMAVSGSTTSSGGNASMPMDMTHMGMMGMGKETMEHGGTLYLGYPIWKNLRGLSSAGLSASYYDDSSIMWGTDATLLRLTYVWGGFAPSLAFSFISDMKNAHTVNIPDQPFIGFRMEYVFGNRMHLGGSDSCTLMR